MSDREGEGGKERERAESPWEDCPTFIFVDKSPVALWECFSLSLRHLGLLLYVQNVFSLISHGL